MRALLVSDPGLIQVLPKKVKNTKDDHISFKSVLYNADYAAPPRGSGAIYEAMVALDVIWGFLVCMENVDFHGHGKNFFFFFMKRGWKVEKTWAPLI